MEAVLKEQSVGGAAIAIAAITIALSGSVASKAATATSAGDVKCEGINRCKGHSDCKSGVHACKGQNYCKGQGWLNVTAEKCHAAGGHVLGGKALSPK